MQEFTGRPSALLESWHIRVRLTLILGKKKNKKMCFLYLGAFNVGYRIRSENPDIRKFRIGRIAIRIRSEIYGSDHRVLGSGSLKFLKNPDPYPIRKPEFFSRYPIRNIRNLKIGSDIRNFGSDRRVFGSDISDQIFLHTPTCIWVPSSIIQSSLRLRLVGRKTFSRKTIFLYF